MVVITSSGCEVVPGSFDSFLDSFLGLLSFRDMDLSEIPTMCLRLFVGLAIAWGLACTFLS